MRLQQECGSNTHLQVSVDEVEAVKVCQAVQDACGVELGVKGGQRLLLAQQVEQFAALQPVKPGNKRERRRMEQTSVAHTSTRVRGYASSARTWMYSVIMYSLW